jgi:hypothetical protein
MEVFISDRPTHFGDEPLTHMTGIWYGGKWAPEVISNNGEDYLAGYGRGLSRIIHKSVGRTEQLVTLPELRSLRKR